MYQVEFKYQDCSEWSEPLSTREEAEQVKNSRLDDSIICIIHDFGPSAVDTLTQRLKLLEERVHLLEIPLVKLK